MKDLKALTQNFKPATYQKPDDMVIDDFAKNIINKVFDQLAIIFPAWKYNWKSDNPADPDKTLRAAKMEWTKAFNENNITTIEQIKCGFAKARKSDTDFLPSCGKFISWCKPSPEDLGWPSSDDAMKECIKHRANQKMFSPLNIPIRPMIVELCKRVDWWPIEHANGAKEVSASRKLFDTKYMELLNSGYIEPKQTDAPRIPPKEDIEAGMSDQQKEDRKQRHLAMMAEVRAKLKRGGNG